MIDKTSMSYFYVRTILLIAALTILILCLAVIAIPGMLVMWWKEAWDSEKARFLKEKHDAEMEEPSRTQWPNRARRQFRAWGKQS